MKALVYKGKSRMEWEDVPTPQPGGGMVRLKVAACGICGSDMHGYHGHDPRRRQDRWPGQCLRGRRQA